MKTDLTDDQISEALESEGFTVERRQFDGGTTWNLTRPATEIMGIKVRPISLTFSVEWGEDRTRNFQTAMLAALSETLGL